MIPRSPTDSEAAAPARRKHKHFLDKNEALTLATSIAGVHEQKAIRKVQSHQAQLDHREDRPTRISSSKKKLKETKALLAAQRAQAKKRRNQERKQKPKPQDETPTMSRGGAAPDPAPEKPRKRVAFAGIPDRIAGSSS
ncbi:hypothetical protein BDN72DRAFT_845882 [Pluteus cervinus]|uniref:Uncharacterized protein n=1 Tax=Pluteus cervinus TaxID=181527 RepID=A0ACD3AII0_9AGAR|nr:hypothetical protein BDN72DRAFT_845882 [Pluteus cervinus]